MSNLTDVKRFVAEQISLASTGLALWMRFGIVYAYDGGPFNDQSNYGLKRVMQTIKLHMLTVRLKKAFYATEHRPSR